MQLKSILLYNRDGRLRSLDFKLGAVNIITGESRTGKSAIIDILDYCLGRSTFNIFEGVNRDVVAFYGVVLQFKGKQVLIAKPAPKGFAQSQSTAYWKEAADIVIPSLEELIPNTNDDAIKQTLSRLLGIVPNQTVIAEGRTTTPFEATIDHAKYYLFQDQNLVANKNLLFWRQAEDYIPTHIKDTIPYFLGAVQEERLQLVQKLRESRRLLKKYQQDIKDSELIVNNQSEGARRLLEEAKSLGMINISVSNTTPISSIVEELRRIEEWRPEQTIGVQESPINIERQRAKDIRRDFRLKQQEIDEAEIYLKQADGFTVEANEQAARLSTINAFKSLDIDHDHCPLCNSKLDSPTPSIQVLTKAFDKIREGVNNVQTERPRIESYLNRLRNESQEIRREVRLVEQRLSTLVAEQEVAARLQETYIQAARISGRVSLYLENLRIIEPDSTLPDKINQQNLLIQDLEQRLEVDQVEDILVSILNIIGARMTTRAAKLQLEHAADSSYRLDVKKLTVIADSPDRPITMDRMGSGENWLGCHLIAFLSLHEYFIKKNRPVPNFLVLDQPTQVYFPSESAYKSLDGKSQDLQKVGADVLAVQRMFDLLFEATQDLNADFQIIVIEHANLKDERFQEALVEEPWTNGKALIPLDWLNN